MGGKQLVEGTDWRVASNPANRRFVIRFGDANNDIIASKAKFPVDAPVVVTYRMLGYGHSVGLVLNQAKRIGLRTVLCALQCGHAVDAGA